MRKLGKAHISSLSTKYLEVWLRAPEAQKQHSPILKAAPGAANKSVSPENCYVLVL